MWGAWVQQGAGALGGRGRAGQEGRRWGVGMHASLLHGSLVAPSAPTVTQRAVLEALQRPRAISEPLVDAYMARRCACTPYCTHWPPRCQ